MDRGWRVTKPNKSSDMLGYSWCVTSVLGSQVFGQASMESCEILLSMFVHIFLPEFTMSCLIPRRSEVKYSTAFHKVVETKFPLFNLVLGVTLSFTSVRSRNFNMFLVQ